MPSAIVPICPVTNYITTSSSLMLAQTPSYPLSCSLDAILRIARILHLLCNLPLHLTAFPGCCSRSCMHSSPNSSVAPATRLILHTFTAGKTPIWRSVRAVEAEEPHLHRLLTTYSMVIALPSLGFPRQHPRKNARC